MNILNVLTEYNKKYIHGRNLDRAAAKFVSLDTHQVNVTDVVPLNQCRGKQRIIDLLHTDSGYKFYIPTKQIYFEQHMSICICGPYGYENDDLRKLIHSLINQDSYDEVIEYLNNYKGHQLYACSYHPNGLIQKLPESFELSLI